MADVSGKTFIKTEKPHKDNEIEISENHLGGSMCNFMREKIRWRRQIYWM